VLKITSAAKFPRFKTLVIDDCPLIAAYVRQFPIYSDFNAVSLFTWGVNNSVRFSFSGQNLIVMFRDYTTKTPSYSILGDGDTKEVILEVAKSLSVNTFERVPELVIKNLTLDNTRINIKPTRDEDDYVYRLEDLVRLEGPSYRKFRRSLSNFQSKNTVRPILKQLTGTEYYSQITGLAKRWRSIRNRGFETSSSEYFAIRRALRHSSKLPIDIWGLITNDTLVGFIITEDIDDTTVLHFEKADTTMPGLGAFLKHSVFMELRNRGQRLLNYEQDLGLPGLRSAKLSLKPVDFMRKYRLTLG